MKIKKQKIGRETILGLRRRISKTSTESYIQLIKWLYDNHKDVLREWEATRGNLRVEFARGLK